MKTKFRTNVLINADIYTVWNEIRSPSFAKDYFPEVRGNNEPSYIIPLYSIGWSNGFGTTLALTRKDVNGNIENINLEIRTMYQLTWVALEVSYSPSINKNYFLTQKCVKGLFGCKLKVLKKEIEMKNRSSQGTLVFA